MSSKKKVLLIGWDAADWEHINPLLEAGLMPTLDQMINEGVMGNLATLEPILSPMLWNSVATGKVARKTRHPRLHRAGLRSTAAFVPTRVLRARSKRSGTS